METQGIWDVVVDQFGFTKMAARSDAAATPGPKNCVFMSVSPVSSSSNCLTLLKIQKTNTSMIARASWISTICTNISFHRRLLSTRPLSAAEAGPRDRGLAY